MRPELPILSFISAISLFTVIPFCLKSRNIPFFSLIAWLLLCNIIQGVNTIVWANDTSSYAPAWCDIVTPITLAVRVALPAITICLCRQLEMISSTLDILVDPRSKYLTPAFHLTMCIFLPVVYIILHVIVQYQRFTIVQNFGCEASIYTSIPAIIIVWTIPLILCSVTLFYASLSLYNYHRRCAFFSLHLHPRSKVTKALFIRYLLVYVFISVYVAFSTIFDMSSRLSSGLKPWTSWASVHSLVYDETIGIVAPGDVRARVRTEVVWWAIPLSTLMFVLVVGSAKEVVKVNMALVQSVKAKICGMPPPSTAAVKQHESKNSGSSSVALDPFKSSWDDTLRSSESLIIIGAPIRPKPRVEPIRIPDPETPISSSPISDDDASFIASTLTYVGSPTGREALSRTGFNLPTSPPNARTKAFSPLSPPIPPSPAVELPSLNAPPRPRRTVGDDLLSSPWPRPPTRTPSPARNVSFAQSLPKPIRRDRSYTLGSAVAPDLASPRVRPDSQTSLRSLPSAHSGRPRSIRQYHGRIGG